MMAVSVAVVIESGAALTLRIRAAGPDPDQKYGRRWARDAGATVGASVGLSDQIALRDGDAALDAATLAGTDLLLLDERSWAQLSSDEQASVLTAVEQGMGLLLRVTGAVDRPKLDRALLPKGRGWVCFAPNYRLSPKATFPLHMARIRSLWGRPGR